MSTVERVDLPPQVAYDLEAQAITVHRAQAKGELIQRNSYALDVDLVEELGLRWYRVFRADAGPSVFYEGHVNSDVMGAVKRGDELKIINTVNPEPNTFNGRRLGAIAAVLFQDQILYKCPSFDLTAFLEHQAEIAKTENNRLQLSKDDFAPI